MAFVDSSDWGMWCVLSDYRKLRKLDIRACSFGNEAQDKSFHVENGPLVQKATIGEVLKTNLLNVSLRSSGGRIIPLACCSINALVQACGRISRQDGWKL